VSFSTGNFLFRKLIHFPCRKSRSCCCEQLREEVGWDRNVNNRENIFRNSFVSV